MKKYIGLSIMALSMGLASCDDYLDKLPDNRAALDTEEKVVKFVTSAYPSNDYILVTELMSDNIEDNGVTNPYTDRFVEQVYKWDDVTETNNESPERVWESSYSAIITANQALAVIQDQGGDTPSQTLRQAKGEALLCRAYNHFILVNLFCKNYNAQTSANDPGIPYMTELEETLNLHHERGTVASVYENIDKDLQEGLTLIGDDNFKVAKFHFNTKAAYGFAARFYLFYEKWDKVIQYATQCLGSNPSTMLRDWSYMATMTSDFDAISQHYISSSANANLLLMTAYSTLGVWSGPYTRWKRFSHNSFVAENETVNAYNIWGGSTSFYLQPHSYAGTNYDFVIMWKLPYLFEYTDPVAQIGYNRTIYPALTTDEVLLSRAEAYVLTKQYDKAVEDLNTWMHNFMRTTEVLTKESIKTFYNAVNYSYDKVQLNPDTNENEVTGIDGKVSTIKKHLRPAFAIDEGGSDQETLLQAVLGFRRIETLQTGLRWFDIKRYGIVFPRRVMDASGEPAEVTDWLTLDDERRAIQIPQDVVDAGIDPNPRTATDNHNDVVSERIYDEKELTKK